MHRMHRMCANCGKYRGRVVIDVAAQMAKKQDRLKEKALSHGEEVKKLEQKPEKTEKTEKKEKKSAAKKK